MVVSPTTRSVDRGNNNVELENQGNRYQRKGNGADRYVSLRNPVIGYFDRQGCRPVTLFDVADHHKALHFPAFSDQFSLLSDSNQVPEPL